MVSPMHSPDTPPYGIALAECVASKLERGCCVTDHHRDFCGMGLWFIDGHYCYDESWDGQPPPLTDMLKPNSRGGRVFSTRHEFVEWLAVQSDHSLAGFDKDAWFHQNGTLTRARLRRELGC